MLTQSIQHSSSPVENGRTPSLRAGPRAAPDAGRRARPVYHGRANDAHNPADWNRYWLDRSALELSQRDVAPAVREAYLSALKDFLVTHRCTPSSLRPDGIGRYLLRCKEERGLKSSSVNQILSAVVFFYQHVVKAPYCIAGVTWISEERKWPGVAGPGNAEALIEGIANQKQRLVLTLALGCGLRVPELTRLKWTDMDFDRSSLRIRRKGVGGKDRVAALPESLAAELKAYRKQHQPITYVFESRLAGRPMGRGALEAVIEKVCGTNAQRNGGAKAGEFASRMPESNTAAKALHLLAR
jgi:integrase/recombinase XerD